MKILVFSDSHSRACGIDKAISLHRRTTELVIFLGDGIKDIDAMREKYPELTFFAVKGNCDFLCSDIPKESILDLDGIRVLITHGDKYNVKYGLDTLLYSAIEKEVDAVFYGHTHIPHDSCEYVNDKRIQLFNPGSVATTDTYGVVNTSNGVLVTGIAKISRKHA